MYFFLLKEPGHCALLLLASVFLLYFDTFIHKEIRIEKKSFLRESLWLAQDSSLPAFGGAKNEEEGIFQSSIYFQKGCPKRKRELILLLKSDKIVQL